MKIFVVFSAVLATVAAASFPAVEPQHMDIMPVGVFEPEGRIIGGEKAKEGQFPYQVGLSLSQNPSSAAWCGGSLISNQWVLTAAHCTYGMKTATVYLGAVRRTNAKQVITSTEFYIHNKYNPSITSDDISLIRLPVKAIFSEYVQPVVLPRISTSYSSYQGDTAIASGWGRTSDNTNYVADDLFYIFRTVDPNSDCAWVYGSNLVRETNVCVGTLDGDKRKSTCNGDSGGPLVLNDSTRTQIGLTSYGAAAGCEKGYPVVFTRVTSYLEWIKNVSGVSA